MCELHTKRKARIGMKEFQVYIILATTTKRHFKRYYIRLDSSVCNPFYSGGYDLRG